jgi:hypothetical protein
LFLIFMFVRRKVKDFESSAKKAFLKENGPLIKVKKLNIIKSVFIVNV